MGRLCQLPSHSRQRGLPAVGFAIEVPERIEVAAGQRGVVFVLVERRVDSDDRVIGRLELGIFTAALIIDRDGVLEQLTSVAAEQVVASIGGRVLSASPVELAGGPSGHRTDVTLVPRDGTRAELPCVSYFALAPSELGVRGGVFVTISSVASPWDAGTAMLESLRIFTRDGDARAPTGDPGVPGIGLPMIK
jgi:hypothetical protein